MRTISSCPILASEGGSLGLEVEGMVIGMIMVLDVL